MSFGLFFRRVFSTVNDGAHRVLAAVQEWGDSTDQNSGATVPEREVYQPIGLYSRPRNSDTLHALAVVLEDETYYLGFVDKERPQLNADEGETALANFDLSAKVRLREDGKIEITAGAGKGSVTIDKDGNMTIAVDGDLTVNAGTAKKVVINGGSVWLGKAAASVPSAPPLDGVVLGASIDTFTGLPLANLGGTSTKVRAGQT